MQTIIERPMSPEALPDDEVLHQQFEGIVGAIDQAFDALTPEKQEALASKPAGRKTGGDESNQQSWA
jgi:hypothetical protein